MSERTLRGVDPTALAVALDHLEEHGPSAALPDPKTHASECVYLKYAGEALLRALAARLPHADVRFKTMGGQGRGMVVRKVFSKAAMLHLLRFLFPDDEDFAPYVRDLASVDRKYWKVL
jgi:hypothetical protein